MIVQAARMGWGSGGSTGSDADIRSFDTISHAWLIRFIEHRIGDRRIVRLIRKWLAAGVLEEGRKDRDGGGGRRRARSFPGPLLGNFYLNYFYDIWFRQWGQLKSTGDMIVALSPRHDCRLRAPGRRGKVRQSLTAHGRFRTRPPSRKRRGSSSSAGGELPAAVRHRGLSKPETFDFLGFTHYCATRRSGGGFVLGRTPARKRMRAKLRQIKEQLKATRHDGVEAQGKWLAQVLRGWLAYYAVPMSAPAITAFRHHLVDRCKAPIRRRGQKHRLAWPRMKVIANRYLSYPRIQHPWPEQRFLVNHPRQEPGAVAPHAGICAGAASNGLSRPPRTASACQDGRCHQPI